MEYNDVTDILSVRGNNSPNKYARTLQRAIDAALLLELMKMCHLGSGKPSDRGE